MRLITQIKQTIFEISFPIMAYEEANNPFHKTPPPGFVLLLSTITRWVAILLSITLTLS